MHPVSGGQEGAQPTLLLPVLCVQEQGQEQLVESGDRVQKQRWSMLGIGGIDQDLFGSLGKGEKKTVRPKTITNYY